MLTLHITYVDGKETVHMKSEYPEISYNDFICLEANAKEENDRERIIKNVSLLSGLPPGEVRQMSRSTIAGIVPFLRFIDETDQIVLGKPDPAHLKDVGDEPWKKLEDAKTAIKSGIQGEHISLAQSMVEVVRIYTGLDIREMPFVDAYPIMKHYQQSLENFFSNYTRLNDYTPTAEQSAAGVERFEKYGFFTTLHALAKGDVLKYEGILNQPARIIYATLVMDFEQAEYQKSLTDKMTKTQ